MKTIEGLTEFCEKLGFGFSVSRASGHAQFTVFIHTHIIEGDKETSLFTQSLYLDDAIGMTIEKAKLLINRNL